MPARIGVGECLLKSDAYSVESCYGSWRDVAGCVGDAVICELELDVVEFVAGFRYSGSVFSLGELYQVSLVAWSEFE